MSAKLKKFSEVKPKLKRVAIHKNTIGADPELFVKRSGKVIGSEKVIQETNHIVEDGVQVELHPEPNTCRETFGSNIIYCMRDLRDMLQGKRCKVTDEVTVDVSKSQYDSLSDKNKEFGCGRSYNAHTNDISVMEVDPSTYLKRSAGGHIHLGRENCGRETWRRAIDNPARLVPVLDVLVANTCVLLDRDEGNKERRKHYGQAGEFRTPAHGLEYRTLSNFWLRGEPLMSLIMGLARHSIAIVASSQDKHLFDLVSMDDVIKAVNENDYDLARKNWEKYKHFITATATESSRYFPIRRDVDIQRFEYVVEKGLDRWFDRDLIKAWTNPKCGRGGWNTFNDRVAQEIEREIASKA